MKVRSAPRRAENAANDAPGPQAEGPACWRLPSGLDLAEFALRGGFLVPALMEAPEESQAEMAAQPESGAATVGGQQ